MSRLEQEDVRAILSVFDKKFEHLQESKQQWLTYKIQEAFQELAPRFKNHAVVVTHHLYRGIDIYVYKLRNVPPRTESLFNSDVKRDYTFDGEYYIDNNIDYGVRRELPLFEEFNKIVEFYIRHSNIGPKEFHLKEVIEVRGDFQPTDEDYGVPAMYREK